MYKALVAGLSLSILIAACASPSDSGTENTDISVPDTRLSPIEEAIDDLRVMRYSRSNALPGLARAPVMASLKRRFDYIFEGQHGYPTLIDIKPVENVRMVAGFGLAAVEMPHGPTTSTGYRFDADGVSLVYATDHSEITDGMLECFDGADVIISDCLRRDPHPSHATVNMAVDLAKQCRARKLVLTHLDKSMDYRTLCDEAPKHVTVGFDGLEMNI